MSLSYELRRERHAIGEFVATIELFQPVSQTTFASVASALKPLADKLDLPALIPMQVFQFSLGGALSAAVPAPSPAGIGYQRFAANGEVEVALVCDSNSVTFSLRNYTVWAEVCPLLVDVFKTLLREYVSEVPAIKSIKIQYLNEFIASTGHVRSAAEIFRTDSKWLAPFGYDSVEPWHCHIGQFIPVDENLRMLVNVNADVSTKVLSGMEGSRNDVKLLIVSGCFYNIPGGQPLLVSAENLEERLGWHLDTAHQLEKDMLSQILSDQYLAAVGA